MKDFDEAIRIVGHPTAKKGFVWFLKLRRVCLGSIYRTTVFQNIDLVSSMGEKGPGPHHMCIHKLYEIFSGIIRLHVVEP